MIAPMPRVVCFSFLVLLPRRAKYSLYVTSQVVCVFVIRICMLVACDKGCH